MVIQTADAVTVVLMGTGVSGVTSVVYNDTDALQVATKIGAATRYSYPFGYR